MNLTRSLITAALLIFATPQVFAETLLVAGESRDYILDGFGTSPKPTIIALHSGGGSAKRFRSSSGLNEIGAANGFAIVWPDSADGNWNDGRVAPDGQLVSAAQDEAFILALVADLIAKGVADPKRIFVTGHSNGGMMSFALGCKHPEIFKAIAPVSANIPLPMACKSGAPIAALNIVGLEDRVVPFEGGGIFGRPKRGALMSVEDGLKVLLARNGCMNTLRLNKDVGLYLDGEDCKASTMQVRLKEQGHRWPSDAAGLILRFFKRQ